MKAGLSKRIFIFACCLPVLLLFSTCSLNNVNTDHDLKKYFDQNQVTGCFGLFDNGTGDFTVYDVSRFRDSVYSPASTFKIINSLIGVEIGRIKDENSVIPWNGIASGRPECDKDLTMRDAFRISCPPWYQELARRIGKDTMQHWLDTLGYARRYNRFVIQDNLDTFWLDNSARITADEQLGIVKRLYFDQLPFQRRTHEIVRRMMLMEDNANYSLSYKTGWGSTDKKHSLGWVVGWIEENRHPYFFVLQVENASPDFDIAAARLRLLKDILKHLGFMEGKK